MYKQTRAITRLLSFLLTVLLICQIVPLEVLAENVSLIDEESTEEILTEEELPEDDNAEVSDDDIVCEITEKRDETTKHYLRTDGSYAAVAYSMPVHYQKTGDDEWIEIDNTLAENTDENGDTYLSPVSSPIDVELFETADSEQLIEYTINGYPISWSYENGDFGLLKKNTSASIKKNENKNKKKNTHSNFLDTLESTVQYKHFYRDVDIEYTITSEGVKENIILKSKKAQTNFTAKYDIGDLIAKQTDDQTITLYNGNNAVAEITAPYMVDAEMATSTQVSIKIQSQKDGIVRVKLDVDKNWLNDKDRAYPVTIDPYISKINKDINNDATALYNGVSSSNYPHGSLMVGNNADYGKCRSFLKYNLPTLSAGDMVVGGLVSLYQFAGIYGYSSSEGAASSQINISRVTSSWTDDSIIASSSFSGLPTASYSEKLDYVNTSSLTTADWVTFDVGRTVKNWYNGNEQNFGFVLWANNENEQTNTTFASANYSQSSIAFKPTLTVIYLNNKGLESRWTYHSQSLGESGTSYINDCTGNLVIVSPVCHTVGNNSPAEISLVYNGYLYKNDGTSQGLAGKGWRFDFNQRIIAITSNSSNALYQDLYNAGFRYIYVDADGTDHYFKAKSGSTTQFEDEEGLNYTLTVNSSDPNAKFTLEFKSGAKNIYKSDGAIRKICDADNNYYQYIYDSNDRVTSIKDGAGRYITIKYSGNNVSSVTDPAGRETLFTYHSTYNLLTAISYPDGTTTQIKYSAYRVCKVISIDGTGLEYTYPTSGDTSAKNRVEKVEEFGTDGTVGASIEIEYQYNNRTLFRDNKGRVETYIFDNYGRTVCINDASNGGWYYDYYQLKEDDDPSALENKLTSVACKTKYVDNLLKNHSFENSQTNWVLDGSGGTCSAATDSPYLGEKSLKIQKTSATNLKWYQKMDVNTSTFKAERTYTFSAYVKTTSDSANAMIYANCFDNSSGSNVSLAVFKSQAVTEAINEYKRIYVTFTIPNGTDFVNFVLSEKGLGTTYFDCIQVESGDTVNDYNLLEESNFNNPSSSVWSRSSLDSTDKYDSSCYKMTGNPTKNKHLYQTVKINKPASKCVFSLSGTASGTSVPLTDKQNRYFALSAVLVFTDGTSQYCVYSFNPDVQGWQYNTAMVKASSSNSSKTIKEIRVRLLYFKNANTVYFDKISLNIDETGTSYTYDGNGNLITAKDNADKNQTFSYDNAKNLLTTDYEDNTSYTYKYQDVSKKYRLLEAKSNKSNICISYGYNAKGSVNSVTVSGAGTDEKIVSTSEYNGINLNYLSAEIDSLGNRTSYTYNTNQGTLATVTDSAGTVTSYEYDDYDKLKSVSVDGTSSSVEYTYNDRRALTNIYTGTARYLFGYDSFMNVESVAVGSRP